MLFEGDNVHFFEQISESEFINLNQKKLTEVPFDINIIKRDVGEKLCSKNKISRREGSGRQVTGATLPLSPQEMAA
jgi:hypothetical protein